MVGESDPHEQSGILGQRPCQRKALTLAAGQGVVVPVREEPYPAAVDGVGDGPVVRRAQGAVDGAQQSGLAAAVGA